MINTKSLLLATAAAALFASGYALAQVEAPEATVKCAGVNACKGQGECQSATNACKGQNTSKETGWMSKTEEDCKKAGGEVVAAEEPAE